MDESTKHRIYTKCRNAAYRLQAECYSMQSKKGQRRLRQFLPCPKGLVYSAELSKETPRVLSEIGIEASLTPCDCHKNFTASTAIEYEHDTTYNPYALKAST